MVKSRKFGTVDMLTMHCVTRNFHQFRQLIK